MTTTGIYCRKCGYDLRASKERCPECGRAFEVADEKTFRRKPLPGAWFRWGRRVAAGLLVVVILLGGTWGWLYWGWKSEQRAIVRAKLEGAISTKPLGGEKLRRFLGSAGFVLERVNGIGLPQTTTDADMVHLKQFRNLKILRVSYHSNTKITDAGLVHMEGLSELSCLDLSCTQITDAGLIHLSRLKKLEVVDLSYTKVSGSGLVHLTTVTSLDLYGTSITDAGLEYVKELRHLRSLELGGTEITDAGMVHLKELHGLVYLNLIGTNVSDTGLAHLKDTKTLKGLCLNGTKVTKKGVEDMRTVLRGASIWGGP